MPTPQRHYIIYVPGLADKTNYYIGQRTAFMLFWRSRGVRLWYFRPRWADKTEPFSEKRDRLVALITHAAQRGYAVSLVASSAGASLALNAYHAHPEHVHKVISICAKLRHSETVPKELFEINPAFRYSIAAYQRIEPEFTHTQRANILSVRATRDSYVPQADGVVEGAHVLTMHSVGHVFSIFIALTAYSKRLIRFIRDEQK